MMLANGVEVLLHVGIDTVDMQGDGFSYLVHTGDEVKAGTPLLTFSRAKIKAAGHSDVTVCVITNKKRCGDLCLPHGHDRQSGRDGDRIILTRTRSVEHGRIATCSLPLMDGEENSMADFKNKVVYQIYPKSFKDSNGDGIGDLRGVIDALDYLADMGVDYLWLTPFFVSPQKDNGYDIADYLAIDPHFGTMDDFDALVKAADAKGLKIMLDMVLCHTSDQHAWFRRALAGDADYQRYYILRDGRNKKSADDPGEPPTNWQCAFGGSA